MALESSFNFIDDLNSAWPDGSNSYVNGGDNHLQGIKSVLKNQFPNLGSNVMSATALDLSLLDGAEAAGLTNAMLESLIDINATPTEINRLVGVTNDVQPGTLAITAAGTTIDNTMHGEIITVAAASADYDIDLETAANLGDGFRCAFLMIDDSYRVTLEPNLAETIGGVDSRNLNVNGDLIEIYCDGTTIHVIRDETDISVEVENTAGTSMNNGAAWDVMSFATEDVDTNGDWDGTDTFTCSVPGKYQVDACAMLGALAGTSWMEIAIHIDRGGAGFGVERFGMRNYGSANVVNASSNVSAQFTLEVGDGLQVQMQHTHTTAVGLNSTAGYNFLNIHRVK